MTTFFTSDTHFSHSNIIKYCNRPFTDRKEMDEILVRNWNETVSDDDLVYHLGDISYGSPDYTASIFNRLTGKKVIFRGNHDSDKMLEALLLKVPSITGTAYYKEIHVEGQMLVLCHYPLLTWNKAHHGSWQLHGHCHGNIDGLNTQTTRLDVGVDSHEYKPISFEEVSEIMSSRSYDYVDHHK